MTAAAFSHVNLLTFDVVGTLIDSESGILNYIRDASGRTADDLPDELILDTFRRARAHAPSAPFHEQLPFMYDVIADELGLPRDKVKREGFPASMPVWPAYPDAAEALQQLRTRFRLVAMTNADRASFEQMKQTLGDPFHDSITVDDVGVGKPDPQFFAYARGRMSVLGHSLADWLHVAQSQYHDIGVAKDLGFEVCWIERRKGKPGYGASPEPRRFTRPDHHFASMTEFVEATSS